MPPSELKSTDSMRDDLRTQYATDANLQARMALHARFSVNPTWDAWIFEIERPPAGARVLEVGCGPATLWRDRELDPSWHLTLTDFTPGMVEAARRALGDQAEYQVADVQQLPFDDGAFDMVIANHMLYHVPDRPTALAEIHRVLTPSGVFHASTIGAGYLAELDALAAIGIARHAEAFGIETGPAQLEPLFHDIRVQRFDDRLDVTDPDAILAYIRSSERYAGEDLTEARVTVELAIRRDGAYPIAKPLGVISATRPPC